MGVDVGSTTSKCVVVDPKGKVVAKSLRRDGIASQGGDAVVSEVMAELGLRQGDVTSTVATGYGRKIFAGADRQISELSCHVRGIVSCVPGVRTLLDVGGQDAKVMAISEEGVMTSFQMNDKCAAGTGRFLDVMASVMGLDICQLESEYFRSIVPAKISSTCTVFAESEVISQLASGQKREDVVAGICQSVSARFCALLRRVGARDVLAMSGGVAANGGVRDVIEKSMKMRIVCPPDAQYMGAIGAALYALDTEARGGEHERDQ